MTPIIDEEQDYHLIGGRENGTHTTIRFSRPWDTCDRDEDFLLNDDTLRVIWAYHPDDPTDPENPPPHTNKGTVSVILRGTNEEGFVQTTETVFDLTSQDYLIPNNFDTTYFCQMFKAPDYVDTTKHQIVTVCIDLISCHHDR